MSSDDGKEWVQLGSVPCAALIKQIVYIPPRTLLLNTYASESGSIWRTTDLGASFQCVLHESVQSEALSDVGGDTVLALSQCPLAVFRSTDAGANWQQFSPTIPDSGRGDACSLVARRHSSSATIFATTSYPAAAWKFAPNRGWVEILRDTGRFLREMPGIAVGEAEGELVCCTTASPDSLVPDIFLTTDDGESWRCTSTETNIWGIAVQWRPNIVVYTGPFAVRTPQSAVNVLVHAAAGGQWRPLTNRRSEFVWQLQLAAPYVYCASDVGLIRTRCLQDP